MLDFNENFTMEMFKALKESPLNEKTILAMFLSKLEKIYTKLHEKYHSGEQENYENNVIFRLCLDMQNAIICNNNELQLFDRSKLILLDQNISSRDIQYLILFS